MNCILINVRNNVLCMQEFDVSRIFLPYFQGFCIAQKINGFKFYTNVQKSSSNYIPFVNYLAWWSRGMIRASGARGPGFNSRNGPCCSLCISGPHACRIPAHAC